jgi:IclR family acetate operon transcriptional repressor
MMHPHNAQPATPRKTLQRTARRDAATGTLDLALRVFEHLAYQSQPMPLGEIAKQFSSSKATIYRHLQALVQRGFVHQDEASGNYEIGVKLVVLGEAARNRFDIARAARDELVVLRDTTQQAATVCGLIQGSVVVLDLIQGRTLVEFGTRPGTRLDLEGSAHGKVWLAFGADQVSAGTARGGAKATALASEVAKTRRRGWASAPNEVVDGVNALAAPVFDHSGRMAGSVAIVGATQFIQADPSRVQVEAVMKAAKRISRALGWKGH